MNQKKTNPTISYTKFDINNLDITKLEDNDRIPSQKLGYIRYKNKNNASGQLYIKTPEIIMSSGGIPAEGPYFPDDKTRAKNFRIPFNKSTPEELAFYEKMKEFDRYLQSSEFHKNVLGWSDKISQMHDYISIVRKPLEKDEEDDDEDNNNNNKKVTKPKIDRPEYMKANFELDYDNGNVKVKIIHKEGDMKTPVETRSLSDALQYIKYMGKNRYIITPNKIYSTKNKDNKTGKKQYGVTFKIISIEAEPPIKNNIKVSFNDDPFLSDDEDEQFTTSTTENIHSVKIEDFKNEEIEINDTQELELEIEKNNINIETEKGNDNDTVIIENKKGRKTTKNGKQLSA
jgi:hypothetical protein